MTLKSKLDETAVLASKNKHCRSTYWCFVERISRDCLGNPSIHQLKGILKGCLVWKLREVRQTDFSQHVICRTKFVMCWAGIQIENITYWYYDVRLSVLTFIMVLLDTGTNLPAVSVNPLLAVAMMKARQRWNGTGVPTQSHPQAASLTLSAWNIWVIIEIYYFEENWFW
jgi:hypothetical protein